MGGFDRVVSKSPLSTKPFPMAFPLKMAAKFDSIVKTAGTLFETEKNLMQAKET